MRQGLLHGELTEKIIGVFYQVHWELGSGFLESVYANAMYIALVDAGLARRTRGAGRGSLSRTSSWLVSRRHDC